MAYPQEMLAQTIIVPGTPFQSAMSFTAAAGAYGTMFATYPFMVQRLSVLVTTAILDLTSSVVALDKVTVGGTTTAITTVTIPNLTAAGKVIKSDCTPVKIGIGDKLIFRLKTQGALGGTPAGAGFVGFLASMQPEVPGNETNSITSA